MWNAKNDTVLKKELIRQAAGLLEEFKLAELEIEEKGLRIRLRSECPDLPSVVPTKTTAATKVLEGQTGGTADSEKEEDNFTFITSPMIGTFYRSPSPESDVFVKEGSKVGSSTVVCIIEAMKVMNEIHAETEGKIVEILVENGESVDFGRPLFKVLPL